ncbi:MAG: SH3 domain-containing protein [Anaerolineales bacterium]|nr:SH3 domain-containing protein [Anaerolineales bacterium]
MKSLRDLINIWVILGAFVSALILLVISFLAMGVRAQASRNVIGFEPADLTIIPGPTSTPVPLPTSIPDPLLYGTLTPEPGVLAIGAYIQITGTKGDGLRLRSEPGLDSELLFLGYDSEVFQVQDGPIEADGYTWWYLAAPSYDEGRSGWAAADFLGVVPSP